MKFSLHGLCFVSLLLLGLSGCATGTKPPHVSTPALASVSVPLARAKDAVKIARDRIAAGDLPAAKAAIALADSKVEESTRALETKDAEVGRLVLAVADRDATIAAKDKVIHQVAKERDIIPYLCAAGVALWLLGLSDVLPIAGQYRFYLKALAFVVGFGSGYAAGRLLVRSIATFLP